MEQVPNLPASSIRKQRVAHIRNLILDASIIGKGYKKEELISKICMMHGCSRRKVLEYVSDLIGNKLVVEVNEELLINTDSGQKENVIFFRSSSSELSDYAQVTLKQKSQEELDKEAKDLLDNLNINNKNQKGVK